MTMRAILAMCVALGAASAVFGAAEEPAVPAQAVQADAGRERFVADCGFCHGRDAQGGSRGLDLTRSELVAADTAGSTIGEVVLRGRADKGMPAFPALSPADIAALAAYIKAQKQIAESAEGGRRSVEPADLLAGDAARGRVYFDANCAQCHAADGDLAGVATRQVGLQLLMKMLNPRSGPAPSPRAAQVLHVKTADGAEFSGTLMHRDKFSLALRDVDGVYRSWRADAVTWRVEDPVAAHIAQLPRYTDADMHDVLAFLMTLEEGAAP